MGLVASPRACAGPAASRTAAPSSRTYSAPLVQIWLCKRGDATLSALGWRPVVAFSRVRETVDICLICPAGAGEFGALRGRALVFDAGVEIHILGWCLSLKHSGGGYGPLRFQERRKLAEGDGRVCCHKCCLHRCWAPVCSRGGFFPHLHANVRH